MALILMIVGAVLFYTGKIKFGSIDAEGKHVKGAGLILMLPAAGAFVLSLIIGFLFAGSIDLALSMLNFVAVLEFVGMIAAVFVAYRMIVDPANAPHLPTIIDNLVGQERRQGKRTVTVPALNVPSATRQAPIQTKPVMTVSEAALYMNMKESQVVDLIDSGQLPAARVNYKYQIAKSLIDEWMENRNGQIA